LKWRTSEECNLVTPRNRLPRVTTLYRLYVCEHADTRRLGGTNNSCVVSYYYQCVLFVPIPIHLNSLRSFLQQKRYHPHVPTHCYTNDPLCVPTTQCRANLDLRPCVKHMYLSKAPREHSTWTGMYSRSPGRYCGPRIDGIHMTDEVIVLGNKRKSAAIPYVNYLAMYVPAGCSEVS
jgi:hypothetical protein